MSALIAPITPITLEGTIVRLAPMALSHVDALAAIGLDPQLWESTTFGLASADDMRRYVESALNAQAAGTALPFVIAVRATGALVGSTRFHSISHQHRRVEIGFSWVTREWQRTGVNREAKYLLLRHAFETWGCQRVDFKTDVDNERSRRALLRLGATEEATLRHYLHSPHRGPRDARLFRIIAPDWPGIRRELETRQSGTQ
jgi:RimJ/RimL family protein N-acetyltransferase